MAKFTLNQVFQLYRRAWFNTRAITDRIVNENIPNLVPAAPYTWDSNQSLCLAVQVAEPKNGMPAMFRVRYFGTPQRWECVNYDLGRFSDEELIDFAIKQAQSLGRDLQATPSYTDREVRAMYVANYPALDERINDLVKAGIEFQPALLEDGNIDPPDLLTTNWPWGWKIWIKPINGRPREYLCLKIAVDNVTVQRAETVLLLEDTVNDQTV